MFVILLSKIIFIFPLMCRYVHHVIKVQAKAEEFASKIKNHLKLPFPKIVEDAKCRRTRFNIKNNSGHVVERSPFTTFIFIWNYNVKVNLDKDDEGICFLMWLHDGKFLFHLFFLRKSFSINIEWFTNYFACRTYWWQTITCKSTILLTRIWNQVRSSKCKCFYASSWQHVSLHNGKSKW
jgi:hypothetical protein